MNKQIKQYLDIDSTYRDRIKYHQPAQFNIEFHKNGTISSISDSTPLFPLSTNNPLSFYNHYSLGPPYTSSTPQEQTNLPYMFSVPSAGDNTLIFLDVLPYSASDPTNINIDSVTTSLVLNPPRVDNYFINDTIENYNTNETRIITNYIYNDTPLILHGGEISSYNINTNLNAIFGLFSNTILYPSPSNINRFYVGKIFTHLSSNTSFNIIDSNIDAFGLITITVDGQLLTPPTPYDIYQISCNEQWYVKIDSPWSTPLSPYPGYVDIPWAWELVDSVPAFNWRSVCCADELGLNVAVGDGGNIMVSDDGGNTWNVVTSPVTNDLYCVIWNNDLIQFVATGQSPANDGVITSIDGFNWVVRTTPVGTTNYIWVSVVWADTFYCAVCSDANGASTNQAMTSTDGIVWVSQSMLAGVNNYSSVTWSPSLSLLCAVINDNATTTNAVTSPTGVTWTARALADQEWTSIVWADTLNIFCAVSTLYTTGGATTRIGISSNGILWTLYSVYGINVLLTNIYWNTEQQLLYAIGWNNQYIYRSDDGINWTLQNSIWAEWNSITCNPLNDGLVTVGNQKVMINHSLPYSNIQYKNIEIYQTTSSICQYFGYVTHLDGTQGVVQGEVDPYTSNLVYYSSDVAGEIWTSYSILASPVSINYVTSAIIDDYPAVVYEFGGSSIYVQATTQNGTAWDTPGTALSTVEFLPIKLCEVFTSSIGTPYNTPKYPMIIATTAGTTTTPGLITGSVNSASDGSGAWTTTSINAHIGIVGDCCIFRFNNAVYKQAVLLSQGGAQVTPNVYVNISDSLASAWGAVTTGGILGSTTDELMVSNDLNVDFVNNPPSIVGTLGSEGICALYVSYQQYNTSNIYITTFQESFPKIRDLVVTDADINGFTNQRLFVDESSQTVYLYYSTASQINIIRNTNFGGWVVNKVILSTYNQIRSMNISTKLVTMASQDIPSSFIIGPGFGYNYPNIMLLDTINLTSLQINTIQTESGSQYRIRGSVPTLSQSIGNIVTGTATTIQLPLGASSINNYYVGKYIWISNRAVDILPTPYHNFNDISLITSYDGSTRTATVTPPFSADISTYITNTLNWEIWTISSDEYNPINTIGNTIQNKNIRCYELELLSISLPNLLLKTGNGNRIAFYPYVYVQFRSISNPLTNIIFSNNPTASVVLFKVPITNVNTPERAAFVVMSGGGMVQTIKFAQGDVFNFTVFLPNGEVFETEEQDTLPPLPANFNVQISVTFRFSAIM